MPIFCLFDLLEENGFHHLNHLMDYNFFKFTQFFLCKIMKIKNNRRKKLDEGGG